MEEDQLNKITERIIGLAFEVSNTLGTGFLEKVYENALLRELRDAGLQAKQQVAVPVVYKGEKVGDYFADIVVDNVILLELKAISALVSEHTAQCINYLRATGLPLCLLINFGTPKVEVKRIRL